MTSAPASSRTRHSRSQSGFSLSKASWLAKASSAAFEELTKSARRVSSLASCSLTRLKFVIER